MDATSDVSTIHAATSAGSGLTFAALVHRAVADWEGGCPEAAE